MRYSKAAVLSPTLIQVKGHCAIRYKNIDLAAAYRTRKAQTQTRTKWS